MFAPGLIGLPLTLNQQALFQANMDAAANKANASAKSFTFEESFQNSPSALVGKEINKSKQAVKRKYADALLQKAMGRSPVELADELTRVQPRTSKGKVYSWMYSAHPKRQRAKITEAMKKEIIEFCKNHSLLKQGEIADIFGVDRTTVTKMLKRSQEAEGALYNPTMRTRAPRFELEDMLYRWISNATKHHPENLPVWSCDQLLEQAEELQTLTDAGNNFCPNMEWLLDFVERFRLKRLLTDFPGDGRKIKAKSPGQRKLLPKPTVTVNQSQDEDLTNAQLSNHKIPKERVAEYTIVETPLDIPMKIEPGEVKKEVNVEELSTEEAHSREVKQLDKFRVQQKAIEEANKLKKDLLSKTLSERKQRAKKEAYKLEHIQKELSKLDHLLTADVNVVREKIEEASREFLEAQKRFQKAETEYVESKIDLHTKSEIKEQLTEHLYTIIHQNEVRKAQKLANLMKELEMEYGEDVDLQLPELPPLTSFQQINLHVSPSTGKTVAEQSTIKTAESSPGSEGGKMPENCDKNSNTIVSVPSMQDNTSGDNTEGKSAETEKCAGSDVGNLSQNSETVVPSFTIVEDGEPVSIVYDVEVDTEKSECNKDVKKQSSESQNKSTEAQKSETEQEKPENVKPLVKTKWDFDGSLS